MSTYKRAKESARDKAIEWQRDFENQSYSWGELIFYSSYFEKLGRRYGLLTEFRENGIC